VSTPNGGSAVRNALQAVLRGFLLGVGFSIALAGVYFVSMQWTMSKARNEFAAAEPRTSVQDILLSDVEEQKRESGATWITGTAKNVGTTAASGVDIQANLFQHGKFVDQYSTYISRLPAGESRYFKIACGCKDSPPADHDSFKVEVVGGY
jgi:hypothetical protein